MHYDALISRYDRPETFFYLDPPYHGFEDYYGDGIFHREDFLKIRDIIANIKGKFLLSMNDVPEIRQIFKDYYIENERKTYLTAGANKRKGVNELLISNYDQKLTMKRNKP